MAIKVKLTYNSPKLMRQIDVDVEKALDATAATVTREAKLLLSIGGGASRTPSTPPNPPHLQTGNLRNSIQMQKSRRGRHSSRLVGITPVAWYGKLHEFGIGRFPKRPFMSVALRNVRPRIKTIFKRILIR